jgi:S-adenosyl-L-methionine hydrolase (adenosine-forming)
MAGPKNQLVTLLTDFGSRDPYVAAMKGVILSAAPHAQIVDIAHDVPAHGVTAASFILAQVVPCFPPETLHVVVVDPGVGTDRRILAARFGGQALLFPDNGVITHLAGVLPLEEIYAVRNSQFVPPPGQVSMTFHGRDIFAPVAGHILNGLDLRLLGPQPDTYKLLDLPQPRQDGGLIVGQVIYIDGFGNLVSNISAEMIVAQFGAFDRVTAQCGGRDVGQLQGTYAFVAAGEALALINSMRLVEVAVNQGRACDVFGAGVGSEVRIVQRATAASRGGTR